MPGRPFGLDEDARIIEMHGAGHTGAAIARRLGRDPTSVRDRMSYLGLLRPRSSRLSKTEQTRCERKKRRCLCCRSWFVSNGPHNHVCSHCKEDPGWSDGETGPYPLANLRR